MSLRDIVSEEQRLALLRILHQAPGYSANETILRRGAEAVGPTISHDEVRAHLGWLEQQALVRLDKLPTGAGAQLWVAILTSAGGDVARGVHHHGVARPEIE
jgi:hypothetical protein